MADSKTTQLAELASPSATDLLTIVSDVSTTPVTKKIEIESLKNTGAEVVTGTDDVKFATAKSLRDAKILDHEFSVPTIIVNGVGENTESITYDDMAYWKATFDKSLYTNIESIVFQVLLQQDNSGTYDVYCQLITTGGTPVSGSEVTAELSQYATSVQTSGDIASELANSATGYRVQAKAESGGKANIQSAVLLVNMKV